MHNKYDKIKTVNSDLNTLNYLDANNTIYLYSHNICIPFLTYPSLVKTESLFVIHE